MTLDEIKAAVTAAADGRPIVRSNVDEIIAKVFGGPKEWAHALCPVDTLPDAVSEEIAALPEQRAYADAQGHTTDDWHGTAVSVVAHWNLVKAVNSVLRAREIPCLQDA